jgi:hypothetical protein
LTGPSHSAAGDPGAQWMVWVGEGDEEKDGIETIVADYLALCHDPARNWFRWAALGLNHRAAACRGAVSRSEMSCYDAHIEGPGASLENANGLRTGPIACGAGGRRFKSSRPDPGKSRYVVFARPSSRHENGGVLCASERFRRRWYDTQASGYAISIAAAILLQIPSSTSGFSWIPVCGRSSTPCHRGRM